MRVILSLPFISIIERKAWEKKTLENAKSKKEPPKDYDIESLIFLSNLEENAMWYDKYKSRNKANINYDKMIECFEP
jgi:hypothetical protein